MAYKLGKRSVEKLEGVDERMVAVVKPRYFGDEAGLLCDLWTQNH